MRQRSEDPAEQALHLNGPRLNYKFQRLREQIRSAIVTGEFAGRLPGERELGRRYHANAKTINKALCDLSSEGLLVRRIGRGTFVAKSAASSEQPSRTFWCVLPVANNGAVSYRTELVESLKSRLAQLGHCVEQGALSQDANNQSENKNENGSDACWPSARRSETHGLIFYPREPLSGGNFSLSAAYLIEAHRRHIPVVVMAGLAGDLKLNAVVPDHVDAGYRLAEHLARLGCRSVVVAIAAGAGRAAESIAQGAQTAAIRHRVAISRLEITAGETHAGSASSDSFINQLLDSEQADPASSRIGIICVGSSVAQSLARRFSARGRAVHTDFAATCIVEPGDPFARQNDWTAYETNPERIVKWTARLLLESRPGDRPVEVLVPGALHIRRAAQWAPPRAADMADAAESARPSPPISDVLI